MADSEPENPHSENTWLALQSHQEQIADIHLRQLFQQDSARAENFSIRLEHLLLDYSKHRITGTTIELLLELADSCELDNKIDALFSGAHINTTEDRPAMHWLLRCPVDYECADRTGELALVHEQLDRMRDFVDRFGEGKVPGANGHPVTRIVSIGIGGSDLGPRLVVEALEKYRQEGVAVDFVSNLDPSDMGQALSCSHPDNTMFIVVSKTFTTLETMTNAALALDWLRENGCAEPHKQLIAVTSKRDKALELGIPAEQVFEFWDWVGGRYSTWSSVGLSAAMSIGMENFEAMLAGAHAVDEHFRSAEAETNIPVILGLLDVWYNNFFGAETLAVVPYDHSLNLLADYLSQLVMESNGKSVSADGHPLDISTSPVLWGSPGTNAQHAFFQMLHQGSHLVPVDFLLPLKSTSNQPQQLKQVANCLAQSEALMIGKESSGDPARHYPGNTPSSTLVYDELDPYTLGMLLAIYEHRTFVSAMIWNINPFDQFGVELGKQLAGTLVTELEKAEVTETRHDSSTHLLMREYQERNS